MVSDANIDTIRHSIERFNFKVDRCIVDGLLSDNNVIIADISTILSSQWKGDRPPEVEEAEKLWDQYTKIKNRFELNCHCNKYK